MKQKFSLFALTLLAGLSVALVGCDKDDPQPDQSRMLVVHASPDAPGVDLLINNQKINSAALTFPNATGYLTLNSGTTNVKVNVAGTSTTAINADLPLMKDKVYSVFAIDRVAAIKAIAVEDDLKVPASGKAHIRFFHLSPGAPAVTVGVLNGTTFSPVFSNRSFETQATASANQAFTPVDAGTYTFDVRVAGSTTSVLQLPGINLQAGKIYTVFARGIVGSTTTPLNASIINNL